jgi:hypothetical protein
MARTARHSMTTMPSLHMLSRCLPASSSAARKHKQLSVVVAFLFRMAVQVEKRESGAGWGATHAAATDTVAGRTKAAQAAAAARHGQGEAKVMAKPTPACTCSVVTALCSWCTPCLLQDSTLHHHECPHACPAQVHASAHQIPALQLKGTCRHVACVRTPHPRQHTGYSLETSLKLRHVSGQLLSPSAALPSGFGCR